MIFSAYITAQRKTQFTVLWFEDHLVQLLNIYYCHQSYQVVQLSKLVNPDLQLRAYCLRCEWSETSAGSTKRTQIRHARLVGFALRRMG